MDLLSTYPVEIRQLHQTILWNTLVNYQVFLLLDFRRFRKSTHQNKISETPISLQPLRFPHELWPSTVVGWSSQKTWKPFTHPTHMLSCFSHPTPRVVPVLVWWAVKGCQPQHRPAMPGFNWFWRFLSVTEVIGYTFAILCNQNTVCILYCKINHYRHIFLCFVTWWSAIFICQLRDEFNRNRSEYVSQEPEKSIDGWWCL